MKFYLSPRVEKIGKFIIAVIAAVFAACGAGSKKSTDMEKP